MPPTEISVGPDEVHVTQIACGMPHRYEKLLLSFVKLLRQHILQRNGKLESYSLYAELFILGRCSAQVVSATWL